MTYPHDSFRHLAGLDLIQPGDPQTRSEAEITQELFHAIKSEREVVEEANGTPSDLFTQAMDGVSVLLRLAEGLSAALRGNDLNSLKMLVAAYPQVTDDAWKRLQRLLRDSSG